MTDDSSDEIPTAEIKQRSPTDEEESEGVVDMTGSAGEPDELLRKVDEGTASDQEYVRYLAIKAYDLDADATIEEVAEEYGMSVDEVRAEAADNRDE